ncbi:UNVERIFIED_CONTAM: hypothetical protein HDU68_011670 [Siphonaria sp. JEL0065]|nr:hypothetical protein HDU68_011670 [Siphonaria sp. JEL0065]
MIVETAAANVTFAFRRSRTVALLGKKAIEVLRVSTSFGIETIDPVPLYLIHQMDYSSASIYTLCTYRVQSVSEPEALLDFEPYGLALGFSVRDKEFQDQPTYNINTIRTMTHISDVTLSKTNLTWEEVDASHLEFKDVKKHYPVQYAQPAISPVSLGEEYTSAIALKISNKYKKPLDRIVYRKDEDKAIGFPEVPMEPMPFHALGIKLAPKKPIKIKDHDEYKVSQTLNLLHSTGIQAAANAVKTSAVRNEGQIFATAKINRLEFYRGNTVDYVEVWDGIGGVDNDGEFPIFGRVTFFTEAPGFNDLGIKVDGSGSVDTMVLLGSLWGGWQSDVVNPRGPYKLRNREIVEERGKHAFWMAMTGIGCEVM